MKAIKIIRIISFILSTLVVISIPIFYASPYNSITETIAVIFMAMGVFLLAPLNITDFIIWMIYHKKYPVRYEIKKWDGEKWNKIGEI